MKVLVTGGSGMLGRAVREVLPEAVSLSSKDGDLRSPPAALRLFEKYQPTHVIHLAARLGGVRENDARNAEFFTDNLLINTNVLHAAQVTGVRRLVSILSGCCYPFFENRPSTEKDLHEGLPYEGNLGYGYAKRALDIQTRLLAKQYGLKYACLTPVTMFGPHDRFGVDGHVIGALIYKCVEAKRAGGTFDVWGDGGAVRQFVYAPDVARILAKILSGDQTGSWIVAADGGITIKKLAGIVARAVGFSGPIRFTAEGPEGLRKKVLRSEDFSRLIPKFAFTPMEAAVAQTAEWYSANAKRKSKPRLKGSAR